MTEMDIDRDYVRNLIRPYLSNEADVEDVAQEVLLKVFTNRDTWNGQGQLMSWVYTIAKYASFDFLKKRNKQSRDWRDAVQHVTPDPAGQMNARHDLTIALAAVKATGPKNAEAFNLRFVQEYTEGEVAELLGVPIPTANARAYRARQVALKAVA
jgi:RNA polymerase sigma-70 factor (ECF subfamily)